MKNKVLSALFLLPRLSLPNIYKYRTVPRRRRNSKGRADRERLKRKEARGKGKRQAGGQTGEDGKDARNEGGLRQSGQYHRLQEALASLVQTGGGCACSSWTGGSWRRWRSTGALAQGARGRGGGAGAGRGAEGQVPGLPLQTGLFRVGWSLAACWGQSPAAPVATAVIPLILLLSPLHLPLLHPTLVDVEGGEGQHDEAENEGDQDDQHQRGGEGLEELLSHLRNAGAAATACTRAAGAHVAAAAGGGGSKGPVEETRRQRQPQLLGCPGTHRRWARRV